MSERTDWTRLEPKPRSEATEQGLAAGVHDPLWMLCRQWQFGEFQGEDGGSPVEVAVDVSEDRLNRVDLRGAGNGTDPFDYEGGPLEAVAERERVMTDDDPTLRRRVEAGQTFLRRLAATGYGEYDATAFPRELRVSPPEEPLESDERRYADLVADRSVDGTAVARAIRRAVDNADTVAAGEDERWRGVDGSALPVPDGERRTDSFDEAAQSFYAWYVDLYEEPTVDSGSAWDPTRLAYRFAVSTGEDETETVFEADEYRGGHLDWYSFATAEGESLAPSDRGGPGVAVDIDETDITDEPGDPLTITDLEEAGLFGPTIHRYQRRMPSRVRFPGMPASRFWEFEDGSVDVANLAGDGGDLARLSLVEFALLYGNEWFQIDLETPVGTLSRITDLTVTDSFGVTRTAAPARDDDWRLFRHDLPGHDEPGLFLPPTLGESRTGDPVETVVFARDEMANLAFAIERVFEGPTGDAVDRTEFRRPELVVDRVAPAEDPDEEYVELANPGEDRLSVSGLAVSAGADGSERLVHDLGDRTFGPGETVRLYTGTPPDDGTGAGLGTSVWTDAEAVSVTTEHGTSDPDVVARTLLSSPGEALADYRLSTDVPEYWFPFTPQQGLQFRLERALLLDAGTLGLDRSAIPTPRGELLRPEDHLLPPGEDTYSVLDEHLPRGGRAVTRRYQYARWVDGEGHLWSSRESRPEGTQLSTGLRFDVLDDEE